LFAQPKVPVTTAGPSAEEIERHVRVILEATSPYDGRHLGAGDGYRALFEAVGKDGLGQLQSHPNDGVAIQAAWEEVGTGRRDRKWFLGFLEGRARVRAPDWWADILLHSMPDWGAKEEPYERTGLDFIRAPKGINLSRDPKADDVVIMRVGKEEVRVPDELLRRRKTLDMMKDGVSALVRPDRCFLAVHDNVGYDYELSCLDRKTGKVVWKSRVFSHWWGAATGQHAMFVAVTEQGGRIVLFGASWTGFHVEAFQPDDGKNVFRFSTGNAGVWKR
jgi:hypothetical protein